MALELQSPFTSPVSEIRDAPVVPESTSVEDDGIDSSILRPLGKSGTDQLRTIGIAGGLQVFLQTASSGQRPSRSVINDLSTDML